jgi:hypothetical protein
MYFITIDAEGFITGLFDGSKDFVHRITGEPMEAASQIPDDSILIGDVCLEKIRTASPDTKPKWDGTCIVQVPVSEEEDVKRELKAMREQIVINDEFDRIDALSLEDAKAELGV